MDKKKVEFIESYIKLGNGDYQWNDNHGELIRCKDCKKCDLPEEEPYEDGYCSRCGYVKMDWFCADGERK